MAQVLVTFQSRLFTDGGTGYRARACGRQNADGMWEGWIEFVPDDGMPAIRTGRETTQPNLVDLEYWATGLTPVYLEGALKRAMGPPRRPSLAPVEMPAYDGPAPSTASPSTDVPVEGVVLDPFSVYVKGEDRLRHQLCALSPLHLRGIIRAYHLADELDAEIEALTEPELVGVIVAAVRERAA